MCVYVGMGVGVGMGVCVLAKGECPAGRKMGKGKKWVRQEFVNAPSLSQSFEGPSSYPELL